VAPRLLAEPGLRRAARPRLRHLVRGRAGQPHRVRGHQLLPMAARGRARVQCADRERLCPARAARACCATPTRRPIPRCPKRASSTSADSSPWDAIRSRALHSPPDSRTPRQERAVLANPSRRLVSPEQFGQHLLCVSRKRRSFAGSSGRNRSLPTVRNASAIPQAREVGRKLGHAPMLSARVSARCPTTALTRLSLS